MRPHVLAAGLLLLLASDAIAQTYDMTLHLGTGETATIASTEVRKITFTNLTLGVDPVATSSAGRIQFLRCYPNPFGASTTIEYALSSPAHVRVRVYDVKGALVRELADATVPGGRYQLAWDGTDRGRAPVSSGLYFYRVDCGTQSLTGRFIRIK